MEEVDKILIHALRQVDTDVPEGVDSLCEFSSDLVVQAVVRCLRVIDPSLVQGLSSSLPPGMSARFRVGQSLAQAVQELGYKGDVGYQTFLYSSEPEIRSLLIFLVEKLPRGSSESSDQATGKSVLLHKNISSAMKAQLALCWLPRNCSLEPDSDAQSQLFHTRPLSLATSPADTELIPELREYQHELLPPVTSQCGVFSQTLSSVLENHSSELSAQQERSHEWNNQGLLSRLTPQEYSVRKRARLLRNIEETLRAASSLRSTESSGSGSDLADFLLTLRGNERRQGKETLFTHTQRFTFTQESVSAVPLVPVASESSAQLQLQKNEVSTLTEKLEQLSTDVDKLSTQLKHDSFSREQILKDIQKRERENEEKLEQLEVKKKTMELLPQAQSSLTEIQALVESSARRVLHLATQWEKHRKPLIEENRRLKELCREQDLQSSDKLSEIRNLQEKISVCSEEARKKEETYKQLLQELESLPQDVSRSAYTQRILEIVGNIRKQKEEISKILSDTKDLQKEINGLTGKLDRTFAVTDELIFKDAKKDESVRKSYKHLAALHENCNQLIQTIEDTGSILREIRDLEEQIESESGNKTVLNLERIQDDYKSIRTENAALATKIRDN